MTFSLRTTAALPALALAVLLLSGCAAGGSPAGAPATTPGSAQGSESGSATTGSAATSSAGCEGVGVVVDFGILDAAEIDNCFSSDGVVLARAAIESSVTLEGNSDYGDAVVCRVDGRPAADETVSVDGQEPFTEPCSSMSPSYAFWALWVKPSADAEWAFALEGLSTLQAEPGQTIGLVYTTGTEPQPPAAG